MQLKKYDLFIRFVQYPVYQWLYIGCYINDVTVNIILRIFLRKKLKSSCQCGKGQEIWPLLNPHGTWEITSDSDILHICAFTASKTADSFIHSYTILYYTVHCMRKEWTKMSVFGQSSFVQFMWHYIQMTKKLLKMRSANSDWGEWSHKNLFWITYVNVDWLGFVNIWFYVFVWLQKTK